MTIRELKEHVKDLPEKDEEGTDYEFWVGHPEDNGLSSIARMIIQLNKGDLIVEYGPSTQDHQEERMAQHELGKIQKECVHCDKKWTTAEHPPILTETHNCPNCLQFVSSKQINK